MKQPVYAYHIVPFQQVSCGVIVADPRYSESERLCAYYWLEREIGYYPLFLSLGDEKAIYLTGYQNQWSVLLAEQYDANNGYRKMYRKAGSFPNYVLFAFRLDSMGHCDFTDYEWWEFVLTELLRHRNVATDVQRRLFKKSWTQHRWLQYALKDSNNVQVLAPQLDLSSAEFIWVRNKTTQTTLQKMGFKNVFRRRIPVEPT